MITVGKHEWSFGNGLDNSENCGYAMMTGGRVIRAGLTVGNLDSSVVVSLVVNKIDSDYAVTKLEDQRDGINVFDSPLELHEGDVLNFKTIQNGNAGNGKNDVVSVLIELDI